MKHIVSFILLVLLPVVASAFDAYVNGIYYNLSENEAEVTYEEYDSYNSVYVSNYTGDIILPASITYNGKTYKVTEIRKAVRGLTMSSCRSLASLVLEAETVEKIKEILK